MTEVQDSLEQLRKKALLGGGEIRIKKQHQKGKRTARERIDLLIDPGTFQEIGLFATDSKEKDSNGSDSAFGDGVITGKGKIDDRPVYLFAQDFTVMGGSVGKVHGR